MKPIIIEKSQMTLLGFDFYGDPFQSSGGWSEENEIGRVWQRFERFLAQQSGFYESRRIEDVMYELHIEHEETHTQGVFEVFVGFEVDSLDHVPVELLVKILPPSTYAVFTLSGEQISSDWMMKIHTEWLPNSGFRIAHNYNFQLYDHRFKGVDNLAESSIDVYIPVTEDGDPS